MNPLVLHSSLLLAAAGLPRRVRRVASDKQGGEDWRLKSEERGGEGGRRRVESTGQWAPEVQRPVTRDQRSTSNAMSCLHSWAYATRQVVDARQESTSQFLAFSLAMTMRNFFPEKLYFSFLHGNTSVSSHDLTTRNEYPLETRPCAAVHLEN